MLVIQQQCNNVAALNTLTYHTGLKTFSRFFTFHSSASVRHQSVVVASQSDYRWPIDQYLRLTPAEQDSNQLTGGNMTLSPRTAETTTRRVSLRFHVRVI